MSPSDTFYPKSPKHNRGSPSVKRPGNQRKWAACVKQPGTDKIWNTIKPWLFPIPCQLPLERPESEDLPRRFIVLRLSFSSLLHPSGLLTKRLINDICLNRTESWRASPNTAYPRVWKCIFRLLCLMGMEGETERKRKEKKLPRSQAIRRREGDWTSGTTARLKPSFTEAVETKERRQIKPSQSDAGAERRAHCRDVKTFNPVPELPVLHRLIKQGNEAL